MIDSLHAMLLDVRQARPPLQDVEACHDWLQALMQLVRALPRPEQQWAAVVLLADDLAHALPGMPLAMTYGWLAQRILTDAPTDERGPDMR